MSIKVSIQDKKQFIQMLLAHYEFKIRESKWILAYLLDNDDILHHTHFVDDVTHCPRSIVFSTKCVQEEAFIFYKGTIKTLEPRKAYHDLRLNNNEAVYIKINLSNRYHHSLYYLVLEENPFLTTSTNKGETDEKNATILLESILVTQNRKLLQQKIDQALDTNDIVSFMTLTNQLKGINHQ